MEFIFGFILGAILGVMLMAIIVVGRDKKED